MTIESPERKANPATVDRLVSVIHHSLCDAIEPGDATAGEVLSALLTSTHWFLSELQSRETAEEHESNSRELRRVLGDFLLEFATPTQLSN